MRVSRGFQLVVSGSRFCRKSLEKPPFFRRCLKYIPTQTQFFGLYRWFQRVLLGFYLLRNNQQNQNQYFFQMDGFTTKQRLTECCWKHFQPEWVSRCIYYWIFQHVEMWPAGLPKSWESLHDLQWCSVTKGPWFFFLLEVTLKRPPEQCQDDDFSPWVTPGTSSHGSTWNDSHVYMINFTLPKNPDLSKVTILKILIPAIQVRSPLDWRVPADS